MRKKLPIICVTGGAGFIGSSFVRHALEKGYAVCVIDKLTYAGDLKRLEGVVNQFRFYKEDICNEKKMAGIFKKENPAIVVNFAAETHVDRSIKSARSFIETNVLGTQALLDVSRAHGVKRFVHLSTDEVYGDIVKGAFLENSPLVPSSPYSASKAAADLLIKSYIRTYRFPGIIVRPSNNYGPWQYPEKLIPLSILKIFKNELIPVYAKGRNVREWLYVDDCARGILRVAEKGRLGEVYNIGSSFEKQNIEVVNKLVRLLKADKKLITFVKDRPGHDIRYRVNCSKIKKDTGWVSEVGFDQGLEITVRWCQEKKEWLLGKS